MSEISIVGVSSVICCLVSVCNRFKAPEGRYELALEKTHGVTNFHHQKWMRTALATLDAGTSEESSFVLMVSADVLQIAPWDATHKVRLAMGLFGRSKFCKESVSCT